jgi:chromosome segregation ATPase/cytoskeletal protein CcmA (bactofilin family)
MAAAKEMASTATEIIEPTTNGSQPPAPAQVILSVRPPRAKNGRFASLISRFKREKETWVEISGYHVGEVRKTDPVLITAGSTLLGNIYAPRIIVDGLLSGSAYAYNIEVTETGQIWGDVFAVSLLVASGGKIQGWISIVDDDDYARLQENGALTNTTISQQWDTLVQPADSSLITNRNNSQTESLHLLQAEIAAILAARSEMEHDFEQRVGEVAGEATTKINTLSEQLSHTRQELTEQKAQLDQAQKILRQQASQIERQTNDLTIARDLLSDQNGEMNELRDLYTHLKKAHETLTAEKVEVDSLLQTNLTKAERLQERVESLEIAHKASLQYTSEQEDSLVRWQELAEITEKRAIELQTALDKAQFQISESASTIDLLRGQRKQMEVELEHTLDELEQLRNSQTEPQIDTVAIAAATAKIAQLETELADVEHEHLEQILWYKAQLETVQQDLTQITEVANGRQDQIAALNAAWQTAQAQLESQQQTIADMHQTIQNMKADAAASKTMAAQWQKNIAEREAGWETQFNALQQKTTQIEADRKNLQTTLRETRSQLEGYEAEVNRFMQETRAQGAHLAEIQMLLVERELELNTVKQQLQQSHEMIEKQKQFIQKIKDVTTEKLQLLQTENSQLKKRLSVR